MELVKTELKIKIYGNEYSVRKPTVKDTFEYRKSFNELKTEEEQTLALIDYLSRLGIPTEVVESLEVDHLFEILGVFQKK